MIRAAWLRNYDTPPDPSVGQIVQSWDTATKDGLNTDWSVCITAQVVANRAFVHDVWRRKVEFPELKKAAIDLARRYRCDVLLIEDQASGQQLLQVLRNEQPRGVPSALPRRPDGDKRTRLAGASAAIEAGDLLLPADAPWLGEFKHELLGFPSSRKDDQVDALSQLMQWVGQQWDWDDTFAAPIIVNSVSENWL